MDEPLRQCRGWHAAHETEQLLEHIYFDWEGVEYWPSEYDLCSSCASQLEQFLFIDEGGWRRPLHYSRSPAAAPSSC